LLNFEEMGRKHSSHPPPPRKNGTFLSKRKKTGFLTFEKTLLIFLWICATSACKLLHQLQRCDFKAGVMLLMNGLQSQATMSPRGPDETTDMGSKEPCLSHKKAFAN